MISAVILDYSTATVYRVWLPKGTINTGEQAIYTYCNKNFGTDFKATNCYWMANMAKPEQIISCTDLQ